MTATATVADRLAPLRAFVGAFGRLLDAAPGEPAILRDGAALLRALPLPVAARLS